MPAAEPTRKPPSSGNGLRLAAIALLAGVAALYAALPAISASDFVRRQVERAAVEAGFEAKFASLRLGYDLSVHVGDLAVAVPGQPAFASVEQVEASVSFGGALAGQPLDLVLRAPRVFVAHLPAGGGGGGGMARIPIRSVSIDDGFVVTGAEGAEEVIGPLTATLDGIQAGQEANVSLEVDPRLPAVDVVGNIHVAGGELIADSLRLQWNDVPLAILADRFPKLLPLTVDGRLDLSGEAAGPLSQLKGTGALHIDGLRYRSKDFEASAPKATVSGGIERHDDGFHFSVTVSSGTVRGNDATFETVIENVLVESELSGVWKPGQTPAARVTLTAAAGEVLWRRVYADLRQHPVKLSGQAFVKSTGVQVSSLQMRVKGIGTGSGEVSLRASGEIDKLDGSVDVPDLRPLFNLAIRDALKESYAVLGETSVRGRLSASAVYRQKKAGPSLTGELRVADAAISVADPVVDVRGLSVDLPLRLGAVSGGEAKRGSVRTSGVTLGSLALPPTTAALEIEANKVALAAPLVVPVLGGSIRVGQLLAADLDSSARHASLSVAANDVGLNALTQVMGWPSLNGTITGSIPKVTIDAERIRSDGEIRAQVFAGRVVVKNLRVDQLFSSIPTLGLDVDFEDISLDRVTETLEVGRMSGVARGAVHNLALVNGQPLSFDAWVETVARDGVSQRVSVDAIRQLSVLGGSGGDALTQGILSFFDEYRYSKMGFRCRLENDKFLLRGVERKEGKEYLVVGSFLPPSVNVISHNQVISFSEMLRRLQRISTASKPAAKKGEQE